MLEVDLRFNAQFSADLSPNIAYLNLFLHFLFMLESSKMQNVILYQSISFEYTKKYAAFWGDLFLIALS
ncbi:hypothetical protein AS358_14230 [Elizabethkingia anophelis]|nr:hypothetical protein AS358_14230 [Elizabethkingia anophelis]